MDITISKSGIIWCIFIIIGCLLVGNGFIEQTRYFDAINFSELDSANWKYGDYVSGNITSLVKREINRKSYNTCSGNYGNYYEFTVPVADNQYVRLYVNGRTTYSLLIEAANQEEFSIPFTGVLSSSNYSINYAFYDAAGGIEREQIIEEFVVTQTSPATSHNDIITGFIILFACLSLRAFHILPPIVTVDEPLEVPIQKRYSVSCDYEHELENEHRLIIQLEQRMEYLHKECHRSLMLLLPISIVLHIIAIVFSLAIPLLLASILCIIFSFLGLFVLVIAIVGICRYYIHTMGMLGLFLRTFKNITPIPHKIETCKANIEFLEEKLAYQNSLTTIYSDEDYETYKF